MKAIFSLSHCNEAVMRRSFNRLMQMSSMRLPIYMLNAHYPLMSHETLVEICEEFNITLIEHPEQKNIGLHRGYNYLFDLFPEVKQAICFDPDALPNTVGWDKALFDAIDIPEVVIAALNHNVIQHELNTRGCNDFANTIGYNLVTPIEPGCMTLGAIDVDWIRSIGGFQEPNEWYGGLESWLWSKYDNKHRQVYLKDYFDQDQNDVGSLHDAIYTQWKFDHAHKGDKRNFDQYVRDLN